MVQIKNKTAACLIAGLLVFPPLAAAADEVPQTTPEGMELVRQTKSRLVYAMPGATLDPYTKVALLDCYVAFKKNWERDYNRSASFDMRIRPNDMERIKSALAEEFRKVFTEELTNAGHEVVDQAGEDVLVIRPALVNLDVTAPDVSTPAMSHVIVQSAGSVTLFVELYDSATSSIIARIMDAQASDYGGFAREANRVTNKAEADRILRRWAKELASRLGEVRDESLSDGE